jgi:CheY-like chemotaxis protein
MRMKYKILIVDDVFDDLDYMKEILEKEDYIVSIATNGSQAIDLLDKKPFNLVIIDIKMPTLTGYDLLRILRDKFDGKMKLIYSTIVPKRQVDLTDVDGFIQKPFSDEKLLKEVKKVLEG